MITGMIKTTIKELNLSLTLMSGQSFRWRKYNDNEWIGIIDNKHVIQLTQNTTFITYKVFNQFNNNEQNQYFVKNETKNNKRMKRDNEENDKYFNDLLNNYFRLELCLEEMYKNWSKSDENFAKISANFPGVRILRQNATENIFSFICSSNNNISRISKMIEKLCNKYGNKLCEIESIGSVHSFPDIKTLAEDNVENELREMGFGYRSKFINKTAKYILDLEPKSPENWLNSLQFMSYENSRKELMKMPGIGPKVADCICLMSFNHLNAIPVDTHVWQIAVNNYLPHLKKNKSLTDKAYQEIGDFFRDRFGLCAGWAHSVLFCADLKQFNQLKNS